MVSTARTGKRGASISHNTETYRAKRDAHAGSEAPRPALVARSRSVTRKKVRSQASVGPSILPPHPSCEMVMVADGQGSVKAQDLSWLGAAQPGKPEWVAIVVAPLVVTVAL